MQKSETLTLSAGEFAMLGEQLRGAAERLDASEFDVDVTAGNLLSRIADLLDNVRGGDLVTITRVSYSARNASAFADALESGCGHNG